MKEIDSWIKPSLVFGLYLHGWGVLNSDVAPVPVVIEKSVGDITISLYLVVQYSRIMLVKENTYPDKTKTMKIYELDPDEKLLDVIQDLLKGETDECL